MTFSHRGSSKNETLLPLDGRYYEDVDLARLTQEEGFDEIDVSLEGAQPMLSATSPKEAIKAKSVRKKKPPSWTAKWGQAKAVLIALEPNSDIKNIMDHHERRERSLAFNTSTTHH